MKHEKTVHLEGNVTNFVTGNPIAGIQLKLKKSRKYSNQRMSGNIVTTTETDSNGNFSITETLSDKYNYNIEIDDEDYLCSFSVWGIVYDYDIEMVDETQTFNFLTAAKARLHLNFVSQNGSSWQDTLTMIHYMNNGESYYQPYVYITDVTSFHPYNDVDLMEGPQRTDFVYTKNGIDSAFTRYYGLSPGELQIINIDLY